MGLLYASLQRYSLRSNYKSTYLCSKLNLSNFDQVYRKKYIIIYNIELVLLDSPLNMLL